MVKTTSSTLASLNNRSLLVNKTLSKVHLEREDEEQTITIAIFLLILIAFLASVANFLVLKAIFSHKRRKLHEYLMLNLVATDAGTCLVSIPLDVAEQVIGEFPYGAPLCHVIYPFQSALVYSSVMTLLFMCIERYRLIVSPLKPRIRVKTGLTIIAAIWLLSFLMVLPLSLALRLKGTHCLEEWPNVYSGKVFTLTIFTLLYLIPLVIMTFLYAFMIDVLTKDTASLKRRWRRKSKTLSQESVDMRMERNFTIVKVFVFAVIVFAVCMLPTHITWLWHDFGSGSKRPELFSKVATFSNILMYVNSVFNPFIFGSMLIDAKTLKKLCGSLLCCRRGRNKREFKQVFDLQIRSPSMSAQLQRGSFCLSLSKASEIFNSENNETVRATKITMKNSD